MAAENVSNETTTEETVEQLAEVAKQDISNAVSDLMEGDFASSWEVLQEYVWPVISVLLIVIVAYFVSKFLARIISTPVRKKVDETLGRFIGKLVFYVLMACVILGVLSGYGVNVTSFAALIAAAGFAVGMAFQGTLGNFASGIMLLVFRPFKVGDVITAAGITAKVNEIDLFSTTFDTPDNRRIIVPNGSITAGTIENISFHNHRRVDVNVGCDYSARLDDTRNVLTAAAESLREKMVDGEGRGYQIVLGDLGDSAVTWTVRFWTQAADFWAVKEALTAAVKNHLDQAGIGIPYPQIDVHMSKDA